MIGVPRLIRRRLLLAVVATLTALILLNISYIVLPPTSPIRLAVTFNTQRASNYIASKTGDRDEWLLENAGYPTALDETAFLIKTGYGTRHRLPDMLSAYGAAGNMLMTGSGPGPEKKRFIVVGDWMTVNKLDSERLGVEVVNALGAVMEKKVLKEKKHHHRFEKYTTLQKAVESGDEAEALIIARKYGWELDALKFIMGMELLFKEMPNQKFYVILDDDTFMPRTSLNKILTHLDPYEPYYLGNAVGDFKGRFAHGGSGVILSWEAMRRLFENPKVVAEAYLDSLDEVWGDRLVALALQKLGIYLDERYSHFFNGENPRATKVSTDKFCSPLVSFHEVREPGDMLHVAEVLKEDETRLGPLDGASDDYLRWGHVWDKFGNSTSILGLKEEPIRLGRDHVGKTDENSKTWKKVASRETCRAKCLRSRTWCLAWTYNEESKDCHGAPWMVLGGDFGEHISSGVMYDRLAPLIDRCTSLRGP